MIKLILSQTNILFVVVLSSLLILPALSPSISSAHAQSTEFRIWSTSPDVKLTWHAKIEGRICPTPPLAEEIGAYYYIIKPDSTLIKIFEKDPKYYCDKDTLVLHFKPDMAGTWSVYAVYQWITLGSPKQQVQSNLVSFVVK